MRKTIIEKTQKRTIPPDQEWLDLEEIADVEVTSEDAAHPIEAALLPSGTSGWRAAESGKQTIRLRFAEPQRISRIWLNFLETGPERTQQYVLRWSADGGKTFREIVRQQWNFNPQSANAETENHLVDLPDVTVLELNVIPDIGGGSAVASLAQLRLA